MKGSTTWRRTAAQIGAGILLLSLLTACVPKGTKPISNEEEHSPVEAAQETASQAETPEAAPDAEAEAPAPIQSFDYAALLEDVFAEQSGSCFYGLHKYDDDYRCEKESGPVPSASVIKIFIMEYTFRQVEQGALTQDTQIGGEPLSALLESMITRSDNDATNTLITYFSMDALNAFFDRQGYADTTLGRKMLDTKAQAEGRDNYTSVADVMKFLDKLYENQTVSPYREMLDLLKRQQVKTKIQQRLPAGVTAANKTGELSNVENDVGIVFTPNGDFAVVFLTSKVGNTSAMRSAIAESVNRICAQIEADARRDKHRSVVSP